MKRNYKVLLITFVVILLLTSAIVYAQTANTATEEIKVVSSEMINKSSEILNDLNSQDTISDTKVVYDELQEKNIYTVSNSKYTINLDESNNLVGIYTKGTSPIRTRSLCDKEAAKEMIVAKYEELGLPSEYELSYLEKYDDEIWQANFEKNYNGIYNKYESVKVYFIPENDEIVALTVFNEAPTNSSVTISEEDAILTAANSLDVSSSEIVSATLSMEKSESDESIHPSWVVQASNNSIVFVDANNNAVIGGDSINE